MADDGFIPLAEFRQLYPAIKPSVELVLLTEYSGERMWKRESDGWYRLEDKPRVPHDRR